VIIHLEDNKIVEPAFSAFIALAIKHKVGVFIHEAAYDDIAQDRNTERQKISLSKLEKFQKLSKVRGLSHNELSSEFGSLTRANDIVDATLLHALKIGAADFLVTQDRGLHERARRHSTELGRRILYIADAVQLIQTTFEPKETSIRFIQEVQLHSIPLSDTIFNSLKEDYPGFDKWWIKCIKERRKCWIIDDGKIAAIVILKDESGMKTDAKNKFDKILKICTFKVIPEKRGFKIGELLLRKIFWFAQINNYNLIYITTYDNQISLIDMLEYFGFSHTINKEDGEHIYERIVSCDKISPKNGENYFKIHRLNYPRFVVTNDTEAFIVPIKEAYHDILYPDLEQKKQLELFENRLGRPGNTIRKVYLCRAPSKLGAAGSLLFFYKGKSDFPPSQAITTLGILEDIQLALSTHELMQITGGRSVYSEQDLENWKASDNSPVKVINYSLAAYIDPVITLNQLQQQRILNLHPPQSISRIRYHKIIQLLSFINLGFKI